MEELEYTGTLVEGDFEENTITFRIDGDMILKAGRYQIIELRNE